MSSGDVPSVQVSVIIPTYNREKDLDECLNSLFTQTKRVKEILIVDDSDSNLVSNLIESRIDEFEDINILLRYIRNNRERSLTIARNIGINSAVGDIVLFLDSDVILDKDYVKYILKIYEDFPHALGVQGVIQNTYDNRVVSRAISLYNKIFLIYLRPANECKLLPSLGVSYPSIITEIINCEWLSGANQSYRAKILEEFKFDENLKKYSQGEDIDMSYRIFRKYPDTLFMTPSAKLIHKSSEQGRHLKKDVIYMDIIYLTYLFYRNIDQSLKNKIIYWWSRLGRILFSIVFSIFRSESKFSEIKYTIMSLFYCMRHIRDIKNRNLDFFNKNMVLSINEGFKWL